MAGYAGGRIKRIKIRNFMTYDDVEIFPKSGLNLIVGLNGSGKSSIMCAICLGLAGKPQFTGRASSLADFVKHGQQQAEIEIELESVDDRNVVITRKIKGDKGEWYLNKRLSNVKEVTNTVKNFNIDTSNLCQFLPQEKVVEFSRMNKIQRLENMLQAIGEPHLFELFNDLKDLYKRCVETESAIKKSQQTKSTAEEKNNRISDEVQKQENRVRLKKELDELLKIKQIIKYRELQLQVTQLKNERKALERELAAVSEERNAAIAVEDSISSQYQMHAEKFRRSKSQVEELTKRLNGYTAAIMKLNEQAEDAKIEHKNKLAEKENQEKRLQDNSIQIEGLERLYKEELLKKPINDAKMLENNQALAIVQRDLTELYQKEDSAATEKNSINYKLEGLKKQLLNLRDEYNKRLNNLRKYDKYTYDAVLWLNENRSNFKSTIYLPIMLEVKVNSNEHCKYIENHIGMRDMIAFVCEDKEDCKRLTDILKHQKKLPVNVVMAPDAPLSHFKSPPIPREFMNWGLIGFLSELISAPEPVMRYLCKCYNINNIPVATTNVDANKVEVILQKFKMFFAGNVKVSGRQSRYGDHHWSVRTDSISSRNLLVNTDDDALRQTEEKIKLLEAQLLAHTPKYNKLREELIEMEKLQEKLRQERKNLQDGQKQLQKIASNLNMKKKYRKQLSVVINEEEENAKRTRVVQNVIETKLKALFDSDNLFKDIYCIQKETVKQMLRMNSLSKELKMTRAANEDIRDQAQALEKEISKLQRAIDEKKGPAKELYKVITTIKCNISKAVLESTMEQNEAKISHVQAQLNLNEDNEPLIKEFNARKRQIEAIVSDISDLEDSLANLKSEMDKKKKEWLEPLTHHVNNINKKFSRYFKHLSCAGEISLDIPDTANDFFNYGLQIKLKFHDDQPMKELSTAHHSGGECSVAAIVFILSLQELTEVPFRCIDEINQGMDSIYERKIYQLIADSVGDDRCSQYFLLTPKLLMDLKYPDDVAVHVIYNSCFLNIKLNIKKMLDVAKST